MDAAVLEYAGEELQELAQVHNYQRTYGLTPHQELTRTRLFAARRLLEETDRPVTDICFAVGFRSPGSFSTLFKP